MKLSISILKVEQVTQKYVDWFSDDEIVKFSENQHRKFTLEGQISYVSSCLKKPSVELYGIFDLDLHIGNISLSDLKSSSRVAEITYVIGEREYWGKGVATFAFEEIIKLAKNKYNLHKVIVGTAEKNIASQRVLEKNNFILEGNRVDHLYFNGVYHNQLDYGLILK